VIDPTSLADRAETIAERRQRVQDRRMVAGVVGFFLLVLFGSLWLALALDLAVRVFNLMAWGG
jgi:hypothetical protein